jgi:hypothetical protein
MQPDNTVIRRRADGTIDTAFYASHAQSLRHAAKQDIMRGIVHAFIRGLRAAISFWNIPTLHGGGGMGRQNQRRW